MACSLHGLAHIGMLVRDLAVTEAFYTRWLGFARAGRRTIPTAEGPVQVVFLQNGNLVLECIQRPLYNEAHGEGIFLHVAIDVTGIEEVARTLDEAGVRWVEGLRVNTDVCNKAMLFEGPDGEILELNEKL